VQVLVDDINTGYQQFQNLAVLRVNGTPLLNLAHLKELISTCKEDYVRLDLEDDRIIMLDKQLADQATERVRLRWGVGVETGGNCAFWHEWGVGRGWEGGNQGGVQGGLAST
jgi:hypothetical protein